MNIDIGFHGRISPNNFEARSCPETKEKNVASLVARHLIDILAFTYMLCNTNWWPLY